MITKLDLSKISFQDAFDLAILIEREAQSRYKQFADMLGTRYEGDAASFFEMMARSEEKHGTQLSKQREALFGKAPSRINADMLQDIEAPEYNRPRPFMSTRHALQIALESETKAHDFFAEAIKVVSDPQARKLFEELKQEEITHRNMLMEQLKKLPNDDLDPDVDPEDVEGPDGVD